MSKKDSKLNKGKRATSVYDQVINEMFTYHQRQAMIRNIKRGLRLRKERLAKLKAPAGTSASNDDISQYL